LSKVFRYTSVCHVTVQTLTFSRSNLNVIYKIEIKTVIGIDCLSEMLIKYALDTLPAGQLETAAPIPPQTHTHTHTL